MQKLTDGPLSPRMADFNKYLHSIQDSLNTQPEESLISETKPEQLQEKIDLLLQLLKDKDKDLALAAEIGQILLQKTEYLQKQLKQKHDQTTPSKRRTPSLSILDSPAVQSNTPASNKKSFHSALDENYVNHLEQLNQDLQSKLSDTTQLAHYKQQQEKVIGRLERQLNQVQKLYDEKVQECLVLKQQVKRLAKERILDLKEKKGLKQLLETAATSPSSQTLSPLIQEELISPKQEEEYFSFRHAKSEMNLFQSSDLDKRYAKLERDYKSMLIDMETIKQERNQLQAELLELKASKNLLQESSFAHEKLIKYEDQNLIHLIWKLMIGLCSLPLALMKIMFNQFWEYFFTTTKKYNDDDDETTKKMQ